MTDIRVRIAPSPTGEPHIGNAYTALVNETFARRHNGAFILRIEDTDQTRSTIESERKIIEALRWLGFQWNEGPDIGGAYGPYRQSERKAIYQEHAQLLLNRGKAFKCFCTSHRLEDMRLAQQRQKLTPRYDGLCSCLSEKEVAHRAQAGEPFVVRMRVPEEGECSYVDGVFGSITIPYASVDMQVLLKSDGMATYHLANVVDDHLMRISHVMRGEEWLPSTPKHFLLYQYFGWMPPQFTHLPVLRNPDRSKLSKRKNPTSLSWFRQRGYLPEAIRNFLALPYVAITEGNELMTSEQYTEGFNLANVAKAGGIFDMQKLDWLNARWIREKLSNDDFVEFVTEWVLQDGRLRSGLLLAKSRIRKLSDLPHLLSFLFAADIGRDPSKFKLGKFGADTVLLVLTKSAGKVNEIPDWTIGNIEAAIRTLAEESGIKLRDFTVPLYVAITGQQQSIPLFDAMALLGRAVCGQRLREALNLCTEQPKDDGAAR